MRKKAPLDNDPQPGEAGTLCIQLEKLSNETSSLPEEPSLSPRQDKNEYLNFDNF